MHHSSDKCWFVKSKKNHFRLDLQENTAILSLARQAILAWLGHQTTSKQVR
jgi:hypothetical protein